MPNPFYSAMTNQFNSQSSVNIFEAAQQFKRNPLGFLIQRKMNVPFNILNDPDAMLNYLVQTKQVPQFAVDAGRAQLNKIQNGG